MRKLNELDVKKQYQIESTNRFAALENLSYDENINRALENIKENIKTSAKDSLGLQEFKQRKPWFDEECLGFIDQMKQAKMQWIHDPSHGPRWHSGAVLCYKSEGRWFDPSWCQRNFSLT